MGLTEKMFIKIFGKIWVIYIYLYEINRHHQGGSFKEYTNIS